MAASWNLWHGCSKISEGCRNCYVYRRDGQYGKDSSIVEKTKRFDAPVQRKRDGSYKMAPGQTVYTCFTSDFFVDGGDPWRPEAWRMIRERSDLDFFFFTKRPDRFYTGLPEDWGDGYDNVILGCSVEDQKAADNRLPVFNSLPVKHKLIVCAPLIGPIDLSGYLNDGIEEVSAGGESGPCARICDYDWVLDIRRQCIDKDIAFIYHQTGAKLRKDGKIYAIARRYQHSQAHRAGIDYKKSGKWGIK